MIYDVSIILCTINEIDTLPQVVKKIEDGANFSYQIVFVDDASRDGTREFIKNYSKEHGNTEVVFNESKKSLLIANKQGISRAAGRFIVVLDADLQHPVERINNIVAKLEDGYDIVVASRYAPGGSTGNRKPVRGLISRIAAMMAKLFIESSRKTTDPLSGFFGFRREMKLNIDERWRGYKTLLFLIASNPGARIGDVPYVFMERDVGKSKIVSGADFIMTYLTELVLIKRVEIRARNGG